LTCAFKGETPIKLWPSWPLLCALALVTACTGVARVTPTPSAVAGARSPAALSTSTFGATQAPASTATITPIPLPFSQLRSASHRALFLTTTETRQAVYIYDHERRETVLAYELIPDIVLNGEQGPLLDPSQKPIANLYEDHWYSPWSTLSPDGTGLAVLQSARDGLPNYMHQVDLLSGQITSILILEDFQWTIPTVPGRTPEMGPYDPDDVTIRDEASAALGGFKWAPDGKGFLLEMRWIRDLFSDGFQLYYVPRASTEIIPLARQTAGIAVGARALWSPDSRRILYEGNFLDRAEGIWMIDLEQPDRARKLTDQEIDLVFDAFWAQDGASFFYDSEVDLPGGAIGEALFRVNVLDGQTTEILRAVPTGQGEVRLRSFGQLPLSGDVLIQENHWLAADPNTPDATPIVLPELTKTYAIRSDAVLEVRLFGLDDLPSIRPSPADDWILVDYGTAMVCGIVSLPDDSIIYGPDEQVCSGRKWSPDGHLILGLNSDGNFTVFDLDTFERSFIGPELDGTTTTLLGWAAEPGVFDELLAGLLP